MNWTNFLLCLLWPSFLFLAFFTGFFIFCEVKANANKQSREGAIAGFALVLFMAGITLLSLAGLVGIYTAN